MRLKAILPAILAVLLMGNCCFASVCQVVCDDTARSAACHPAADDGMQAMPGMTHCAMCVTAPVMVAGAGMSCLHQVCAVPPAAMDRATADLVTPWGASSLATARDTVLSAGWAGQAETPPLYRSTSVSPHTILRV